MKAFVLTVSDRVSKGEREDISGALGAQLLTDAGFTVTSAVVSDDADAWAVEHEAELEAMVRTLRAQR